MIQKKIIIFMPVISGGGVEKNFFIISNYLSNKYRKVSVITLSNSSSHHLNKKIKIITTNSKIKNILNRRLKFIFCLFLLFKEIIQNKNSTVLCFQGIAYCTILCKILSTKIIIRSNSSPSGWSKNIIKKFLYKKIYKMADKIIVNSYDFKNELKKKFNLKSICIYNPLNKKEIIRLSKDKIKFNFFNKKYVNLISVARFSEQKDHECLIKSINLIKNKFKIRLLLVGSGPKKNRIIYLISKYKLKKNIKLLNFKENPFPYIKKSDLFVHSSRYEGAPNVLLEAIVLKKPIISSNCPTGPSEILDRGKGGVLFEFGNYKSLSEKITFFLKNKSKFKSKILYAYHRLSRFDQRQRLEDYLEVLKF